MSKLNRGPVVEYRKGIQWWKYDFWYKDRRYRGWIGAVSELSRRQAVAVFKKVYAKVVTDREDPFKKAPLPQAEKIFEEYNDYLQTHKPNTYRSYKYLSQHPINFFGKMTEISHRDIARYKKEMLHKRWGKNDQYPYSNATINRSLTYCRAAFNKAKISPNPFNDFDRYQEKARTRYLTRNELKALLNATLESEQPQLHGIVLTAIMTGLRKAEILNLRTENIDFDNQLIRMQVKGGNEHTTALPDQLVPLFKDNLESHSSGYVFENESTNTKFIDIKRAWHTALKKAKIENFVFHDLRHTFATYMLLKVKNLKLVQEMLGHADVQTTQKYTHVLTEEKLLATNILSAMVGEILNGIESDKKDSEPDDE